MPFNTNKTQLQDTNYLGKSNNIHHSYRQVVTFPKELPQPTSTVMNWVGTLNKNAKIL